MAGIHGVTEVKLKFEMLLTISGTNCPSSACPYSIHRAWPGYLVTDQ